MGGQLISRLEGDLLVTPPSTRLENILVPLDEARPNIKQIRFENRLMRAVLHNNTDAVKYLIKNRKEGDLDQVEHGCNALNIAIHRRNLTFIRDLIEAGCNLNICADAHRLPPLFQCVAYNLPEYVKLLIDSGCDPRVIMGGENALHVAIQSLHDPQPMVELLAQHIDINARSQTDGRSVVHWTIEAQRDSFLGHLVKNRVRLGLDLNQKNSLGETPVQLAVNNQLWKVASILLDGDCQVNIVDEREQPLLLGVILVKNKRGPVATVSSLTSTSQSGIDSGIKVDVVGIMRKVITAGADINFIDRNRKRVSVLHKAAEFGDEESAGILLESGANPDITCHLGQTPLHSACNHGHDSVVNTLLSHDADIDHSDHLQRTPLHLAASRGHLSVLKILLAHGALIDSLDDFGKSPLLVAAQGGYFTICATLIKGGAYVDCCDKTGKGALHSAIAFPKFDIPLISLLLASGCDPLNLDEFLGSLLDLGHFKKQLMPGLYEWYTEQKKNPRTLKQICRMRIQSVLQARISTQGGSSSASVSGTDLKRHNSLRENSAVLPLPRMLKAYLAVRMIS